MLKSLSIQLRVIAALILREARTRHGRSRLGYGWAILEPGLVIIFLTILFSQFRATASVEGGFAVFFATGVLPFHMFRSTSQFVALSIIANRPLFQYPPVKSIDAVIARFILEASTMLFVTVIVMGALVLIANAPLPYNLPGVALVLAFLAGMGFGAGLCLAVAQVLVPTVANVYNVIMGASFFLSCIFYSLSSVPTVFREILVWNPIVHGVEGFRAAYFGGYRAQDVSLGYLFCWGAVLIFLGLFSIRLLRRSMP